MWDGMKIFTFCGKARTILNSPRSLRTGSWKRLGCSGFEPHTSCKFLAVVVAETSLVFALVYSDDPVNPRHAKRTAGHVKEKLISPFKPTYFGAMRSYLGVALEWKGTSIPLHQAIPCRHVSEKFWMNVERLAPTPVIDGVENAFERAALLWLG